MAAGRSMTDAVVIGAGPVGLACAIELKRVGLSATVVEKGALVNSLIGYPTNMELFSTPDRLEIGGHPFTTSRYKPLREETMDYYRGVAAAEALSLRLYTRVLSVRGHTGRMEVEIRHEKTGEMGRIEARRVIVATGFYDIPNLLGIPGEDLPKVTHYYKEPYAYVGQKVAVIGAKNSAAKVALQCLRNGAEVTMVVRESEISDRVKYWIRPDLLNRIRNGSIKAHFNATVRSIDERSITIDGPSGIESIPNDFVLAMTGYRPDYSFLETIGIGIGDDAARTPKYDPDTFQTNRAGVYLAGTVCGGLRTGLWFIENGRRHAEIIAAHISGATSGVGL
jgi:bacillithiol disulfide reductase